jgi:hypothetical protein
MAMRATPLAFDFDTPGAIFLFLVLVGVLNALFKLASHGRVAWVLAILAPAAFLAVHWPLHRIDPYSPGLIFDAFLVASALINLPVVRSGQTMALNRAELILVYVMLLVVSGLCTMGMSQQLLPAITALFYYATPENGWLEKLLPLLPEHRLLVDDGDDNRGFYEGVEGLAPVDYGAWVEPLIWWSVLLLSLYVVMVSVAVILRRQWVERERLPYPLMQLSVAFVGHERRDRLINGLFRRRALWIGILIPVVVGSLKALHDYNDGVPAPTLEWRQDFFGANRLRLHLRFSLIGFSYLIHTQVAAGIWVFHLLTKIELRGLQLAGIGSYAPSAYSVNEHALLAFQGGGALVAMVLMGLWVARHHLRDVFGKALGRRPEVDDGDEILSYRSAVFGLVGGIFVMIGWLAIMGTPLWVGALLVVVALIMFIGVTRVLAEAGLATVRTPLTAPDFILQGFGSQMIGSSGVLNLGLAHVWCADLRMFLLAVVANGLKLIDGMDRRSRRLVLRGIGLAIVIGAVGSCWMVLHLAWVHGAVNLDNWRFKSGPSYLFNTVVRSLDQTAVYGTGLATFAGGGVAMVFLTWLRHRLPWWPLHPIGFPIGANYLMNYIWFSVFLAWLIKLMVLRFGGANAFRHSQVFFLGLIAGEALCDGLWLIVDYFTGHVGNEVFGIP